MSAPEASTFFKLLCYGTSNIGDDIQSLAAAQFLPEQHGFIDRDHLEKIYEPSAAILNGWHTHRAAAWPPSPYLTVLPASICIPDHAQAQQAFGSQATRDYLAARGPIGARDQNTLRKLEAWGIAAYWSGCLTLTFPRFSGPRGRRVFFVDYWPESDPTPARLGDRPWARDLPPSVRDQAVCLGHTWPQLEHMHPADRLALAASLLERYRRARLIVTTRLHCALPAMAMGTPVYFVAPEFQPERLDGWAPWLNLVTRADIEHNRVDWEQPPAPRLPEAQVSDLTERCRGFVQEMRAAAAARPVRTVASVTERLRPRPSAGDPLVVISLPRATVRRANVMDGVGTQWGGMTTLLPAVDGAQLCLEDFYRAGLIAERSWLRRRMRPGEVGCWLSHLFALDYALEAAKSAVLILEDDACLVDGFASQLDERLTSLERAEQKWDLLLLGWYEGPAWAPRPPAELLNGGFFALGGATNGTPGSFAYLASCDGARRLLRTLCSEPIAAPIDEVFRLEADENLRIACAAPVLAQTRGYPSTIATPTRSRPSRALTDSVLRAYERCREKYASARWWANHTQSVEQPDHVGKRLFDNF